MLTRFALFRRPSLLPRTSTRNVFVDVETTPNPHSMKFKPQDKLVLPEAYGTGMFFEKNNSYCNTVHSPLGNFHSLADLLLNCFYLFYCFQLTRY